MALGTPTQLGAGGDAVAADAVTNAFIPTANAKLFAVAGARSAADITAFTLTDTVGLTWTAIAERYESIGGIRVGIKAWVATLVSTPVSMTVTATNNSAGGQTCVSVFQVTGASAAITNFVTALDASTGDPSITLPTAPTHLAIACFAGCGGSNIGPPSNFAELSDILITSFVLETSYDSTSPPPPPAQTYSYTTAFTQPCLAIGFEIKELPFGAPTVLGTPGIGLTGVSGTTGSFIPTANARLFTAFAGRRSTGTTAVALPTISDTAGLTWNSIRDVELTGTVPTVRMVIWEALAPSSPSSMTVTAGSTQASTNTCSIIQITDLGSDFTNIAHATSLVGDPSVTLGSAPTGSVIAWMTSSAHNAGVTTPSGFTQLLDFVGDAATNPLANWLGYDNTTPGTGVAWTTTGTTAIGIALDVRVPVVSGGAFVSAMGWIG